MRSSVILAGLLVGGVAFANGRPPLTNGITFRPGDAHSVYLRTTFGLLISHDDCSFRWVCEQNIGYSGMFDPKYAVATDGTIFATTYTGLRVSRDNGCTFTSATSELPVGSPNRIADAWIDNIDIGPTGEIWVTTADSGKPNDVYRSTDNGVTFTSRNKSSPTVWWKSVKVAPTDAARIYITGYEVASPSTDGGAPMPKAHLLRSDDSGDHWMESALAGVEFGPTATSYVVAVHPTDANTLFYLSESSTAPSGDKLYRSSDGGATLQLVLSSPHKIKDVLITDPTHVVVALGGAGSFESKDGGATFAQLGNWQDPQSRPPQLNCLGKRGGELFGCGANWVPDYKALAHSTDGATWQKEFRFVEIAGALDCPAGTPGKDTCEPLWTGAGGLQQQFATTGPQCTGSGSAIVADVVPPPKSSGGCCDAGTAAAATSIPLVGLVVFALRRKRKRACCS